MASITRKRRFFDRFRRRGSAAASKIRPSRALHWEPLERRELLAADIVFISELMADNDTTLTDQFGRASDWAVDSASGINTRIGVQSNCQTPILA